MAPYLAEYPRAERRATSATAPALYSFQFDQTLDQNFVQGRVDYNLGAGSQLFARYTLDDAEQWLPTDYPQFPRCVRVAQSVLHRRVPAGADAEHC